MSNFLLPSLFYKSQQTYNLGKSYQKPIPNVTGFIAISGRKIRVKKCILARLNLKKQFMSFNKMK